MLGFASFLTAKVVAFALELSFPILYSGSNSIKITFLMALIKTFPTIYTVCLVPPRSAFSHWFSLFW